MESAKEVDEKPMMATHESFSKTTKDLNNVEP